MPTVECPRCHAPVGVPCRRTWLARVLGAKDHVERIAAEVLDAWDQR